MSILDAPVNVTSNRLVPTISTGANRLVLVIECMYNGAGNATAPTAQAINGVNGIFVAGDNAANNRVAAASFLYKEADVGTISGQLITISGQSGTVRSTVVMSLQGQSQVTPSAVNKAYASSSGALTLGLTRAANSFTVLLGYTSTNSQAMNMTNPTRDGNINFSNGTLSYAYEADTAQTIDSTLAGSNFTTAHIINFQSPPSQTITSVNSGNPVVYGEPFTWTTSGFSPAPNAASIAGIACSSVSGSGGTAPAISNGATLPMPGTRQLTGGNGTQSANFNVTVGVEDGYFARLLVGTPDTGAGSVAAQFIPPAKANDQIIYLTANNTTIDDKGRIKTDSEDPIPIIHLSVDEGNANIGIAYLYQAVMGLDGLVLHPEGKFIEGKFLEGNFIRVETF